jgi:predicted transcriptional regulator of viral defense system
MNPCSREYAFRTLEKYDLHTQGTTVATTRSTPIPAALARAPLKTIRPRDAAEVYAHPRTQLVRLADRGLLHRVAEGYYVVVPQEMMGRKWIPSLEAAAAGIATAIHNHDDIVVMGLSAARLHGVIPRALATAVVAVPRQHRPIALTDRQAIVQFVKRDTDALDAELFGTELGPALVTTPEQTVLDLAHRPTLGDSAADVPAAVAALYARSEPQRLQALATEQRRLASLRRAEEWAGADHGS